MITMDGDDTQEKLWQKVQRKLWLNISKLLKKTKKTIKNYIGSIISQKTSEMKGLAIRY